MASNRPSDRKDDDLSGLIPIIILFCIPTGVTQFISIMMLIRMALNRNWFARLGAALGTLFNGSPGSRGAGAARDGEFYNVDWSAQDGAGPAGSSAPKTAKKSGKSAKAVKKPGKAGGNGLIVAGGILSGIFGIGTIASFLEWIRYLAWSDLEGALVCAMFLVGALVMLASGIGRNKERDRFSTYLAYIGANREVDLARMAANLDVPVKKLCRDLRRMLAKGYLPTGYVDLSEGKLFLTEMGYRAPAEEKRAAPEPEPAKPAEDEDAILKEIRQVNDFIPDAVMTEKIDRIEEITRKILAYQKKHPDRAGQLRSFLNYYLPTTLKILRAYAQLDAQGVEGENISAAKARIEGMMDQVVYGFEKQLDKLFQEDAMDVAADVEVLENMLKKDGLSDGQGMTLGM